MASIKMKKILEAKSSTLVKDEKASYKMRIWNEEKGTQLNCKMSERVVQVSLAVFASNNGCRLVSLVCYGYYFGDKLKEASKNGVGICVHIF